MRCFFPALLVISACTSGKNSSADTISGRQDSPAADSSSPTDTDAAVDADGDGAPAGVDCDDTDPAIHPGAEELCDGIDSDCDGVADNGVPSDGAGCQDPGWPTFPEEVGIVQVVLATATSAYAGSDSTLQVCLGADWCQTMGIPDWNDREEGSLDVHTFEDVDLRRADVTAFRITTSDGSDRWEPAGFAVSLDGEGVYTRASPGIYVGTDGGDEVSDWTDSLARHDDTIWPRPLTHGPLLGAPLAGGARIWLRTDHTRHVALRVAPTAEELVGAPPVAHRYPRAEADFTETITVYGLGSRRRWAYDLTIDGVTYGPWSLVSGPDDGEEGSFRLVFGSCTKDDEQPIFEKIRAEQPDLFLFIGDNHYGNTPNLDALRQQYRWAHTRTGRAELMAEAAILATWDDHDYVGNNTDGSAEGKQNALRVFGEYWGNGGQGTEDIAGVFSVHRYGDVDIWLLDDRYWRGLDGTLLGSGQEAWLLDSVAASTATFKLIASGSQWTLEGSSDSWAAFPAAQARIVDALSEAGGVVLLSGDIHRSELRSVPASAYSIPELTSSPLANSNSLCSSSSPDRRTCYDDGDSFIVMDIDTTTPDASLTARLLDADGAEVDRWVILRSVLGPP